MMMLYAVIILIFLFYLFIPVYAHKVSRGDDLDNFTTNIFKVTITGQFIFMGYLIWITAAIAHEKHLVLQYMVSNVLAVIVAIVVNVIFVTYITDRYLPKIKLNLSVYDRLTVHENIWIMGLLAVIYYIAIWFFYNQFNPYTM